ncbi:hypothetical protein [Rheinheimera baltica]|uniref:hypothetical protein n=1 Tax=Rheinheimera baltica TaxID=67576 RepID=UPI00273E0AE9|nr:hypothetical protein [Rheinheimera baltica]MDP5149787.1 hypothetical protein [Rheinheimera baltica]
MSKNNDIASSAPGATERASEHCFDNGLLQAQVKQQADDLQRCYTDLATQARLYRELQVQLQNVNIQMQQALQDNAIQQQVLQHEQAEQKNLLSTIANLESQLTQRFNELTSVTRLYEQHRTELNDVNHNYQLLNEKLVTHESTATLQAQQIETLTQSYAALESSASELSTQLQLFQQKYTAECAKNEQLTVQKFQADKQRYTAEMALSAKRRELHISAGELAQLSKQNAQLVKSNNALQAKLKQMKMSRLYRLTQLPLKLANFVRGNKQRQVVVRNVELIKSSGLFDADWYLSQYSDVKNAGMSPLQHYLLFGGFEGRNPNKDFDSAWYLTNYSDVSEQNINPLLHYIKFGRQEGRITAARGLRAGVKP